MLTTEVIDWARGAVREAVLAAQLMHFAHRARARRRSTSTAGWSRVKDDEFRPYAEAELRELHAQVTDPNFRIFADADWIYVFNADRFVKGTDFNEIFDQLGVDEATHAFYLGKELMKATIARAPAQELPPGVAARLGLHDVRRAEARARAAHGTAHPKRRRGGNVKKILIQLDTDEHPSTFDAIVAHDAGVGRAAALRRHRARRGAAGSCSRRSSPAARRTSQRSRCGSAARACGAGEEVLEAGQEGVLRPVQACR